MMPRSRAAARVAISALLAFHACAIAFGAEWVRVSAASAAVRAAATAKSAVVATVAKGTRLEVVAKAGDWYRVLLPADKQGTRLSGYIEASLVSPEQPARPPGAVSPAAGKPAVAAKPARAAPKKPSRYTFRGFGSLEYEWFQATSSFNAIFGSATGLLYGGGVDVSIGPLWFVQGRVSHVSKTGERAYVHDGEISRLGIAETAAMTPIDVTVGYRVAFQPRFTPYVAGGIGSLTYSEASEGADTADNSSGTFLSYHVAAGVEVPLVKKWLSVAGEFQYRGVPGAIGSAGVSKAYGETNLGGASLCVKFLVGPQPPRKPRPAKPVKPPPKPPAPKR